MNVMHVLLVDGSDESTFNRTRLC